MTNYSVLMSVYRGENAENFWQSVQSVLNQPFVTNDFVIVCDGPLTWELDAVLEKITAEYDSIVNVIRLPENVGIGAAANIGLQACQNELVAKMDSDDIAVYGRFALQCDCFEQNEQLSVLGGYIEEFDDDPDKPVAVREVPVANEEIRQMARRRQPFNNTTVMYRKSAVIAVGGYRNFRRNEDYDLYVRLLHAGYYTQNLDNVLVKVRVGLGASARRVSWLTFKCTVKSRWAAHKIGFSTIWDFFICFFGMLFICICPAKIQKLFYQKIFRKKC